jgi:hypothetical protein
MRLPSIAPAYARPSLQQDNERSAVNEQRWVEEEAARQAEIKRAYEQTLLKRKDAAL